VKSVKEWNTARKLGSYKKKLDAIDFDIVYDSMRKIHDLMEERYEELGSREKVEASIVFWRAYREDLFVIDNDVIKVSISDLDIDEDGNKFFHVNVDIPYYRKEFSYATDVDIWDFIGAYTGSLPIKNEYEYRVWISVEEMISFIKEFVTYIDNYWNFLKAGYKLEQNKWYVSKKINLKKIPTWNKRLKYEYIEIQKYLYSELEQWLEVDIFHKNWMPNSIFGNEIYVSKSGVEDRFLKISDYTEFGLTFDKVDFEDAEYFYKKVEESLERVFTIISSRTKVRKIAEKVAKRLDTVFSKENEAKYLEIQYEWLIEDYKKLQEKWETIESEFNIQYLTDCVRNIRSEDTLGLIARHSSFDIIAALAKWDVKQRHYYYFNKLLLWLAKSSSTDENSGKNSIDMVNQIKGEDASYHSVNDNGEMEQNIMTMEGLGGVLVHIVADGYITKAIDYFKRYTEKTWDTDWLYMISSHDSILSSLDIDILTKLLEIVDEEDRENFLETYYKRLLDLNREELEDWKDIDWNRYKYFTTDEHNSWRRFCIVFYRDYRNKLLKKRNLASSLKSKEKTVEEILIELWYDKYEFYDKIVEEIYKEEGFLSYEKMLWLE